MNAREIEIVQRSWQQVAPIADAAAELFYGRLFELDPSLKTMFRGDMRQQGRKLTGMIGFAVERLGQAQQLIPALRALGERHAGYGVRDEHYVTVAAALLWTLEQGLGDSFTAEVRSAWLAVYAVLANAMKDAARLAA